MPAHAKEIDSREKYGLMVVWFLVISVCLILFFSAFVAGILTTVWIGLLVGLVAVACSARLIIYTKDLIRKTA